jgi:Fe-S oxidoreductase
MPERTDYWGIPYTWGSPNIFVYTIMGLAVLIMLIRLYLYARLWWQIGRPEKRWDKLPIRIGRLIKYVVFQIKVLWERYPGIMHIGLAWGFFVFFMGTALATIDSHFIKFLTGNTYLLYKFVLDLFTVFFIIGAGMAAYRRYFQRPSRLTLSSGFTYSLVLIVIIVMGGLVTESLRLAVERPAWGWWTPAGWGLAQLWIATGGSDQTLTSWHLGVWIVHLLTVALLFVTIPGSTLAHLVTAPLNTFFSKIDRPIGGLAPIAETKDSEPIFVDSLGDFAWPQLLASDACTECGRCQDACPAFAAGTPLSPKQLILNLRDALHQDGPSVLAGNGHTPSLVGERIKDDVLWSCTTCGACVRECPVLIEHIDTIVDMRRYLVIEGRVDDMLQDALSNLGRYGNSFGQSERARAKWTRNIEPQIKDARKEPVEYLWFVGDYASYSASLAEVTQHTADVFNKAGINFGIMYEAEQNAGNDARRVGEEGLFEMLVEKNVKAFSKCKFNAIVTTDPHSYNTLKNEYNGNNGHFPVLHYSELLDKLITSGELKFSKKLGYKVTYHDPCYLGRYNDVYDAPRRVIAATGCELVEMPRHRARAFCCGAGGGRIWMEEGELEVRPSEDRIREAVALEGVSMFVVACPKDVTMYRDAVKTTGMEEKLVVKDLIELVEEAL